MPTKLCTICISNMHHLGCGGPGVCAALAVVLCLLPYYIRSRTHFFTDHQKFKSKESPEMKVNVKLNI